MNVKFWAHSDPDGLAPEVPEAKWQPLAEHLRNAARLARELAELAAPAYRHFHDLAEWCGLLHDYGKYTDCFQKMILPGGKGPCPHSIHGAVMAYEILRAPHVATVIAGHHAGLPNLDEFRDKVAKNKADAFHLLGRASDDLAEIAGLLNGSQPKPEHPGERFDLLTRMLLSCLADADRLDTAGRAVVQAPLEAARRLEILLAHLSELAGKSPEGAVKNARKEVLEDCLRAAALPDQIFSLSVPTGGGKTLAAMAFALKRAALEPERFRRIIVVIPFLDR